MKANHVVIAVFFSFMLSQATQATEVISIKKLTDRGGRLAWYHGQAHNLIAYDALTAPLRKRMDVFTMQPDGSGKQCITRDMEELPEGYRGQPDWHADGFHLVIQAENENSESALFNHVAWGINNDLWLITTDGSRVERIWRSPLNHGALHPHFDKSGSKIIFSERVATGRPVVNPKRYPGAGGENQWDGWRIHLADVNLNAQGEQILGNHRILFQNWGGMFETHGFTPDGRIVFSHTAGGRAFVDDIYIANADGTNVQTLVKSPGTWDEHGHFSPSGQTLAFMSSRANTEWKAPRDKADTLTTELYIKDSRGVVQQLTNFNDGGSRKRFLVSDLDWDRTGRHIAFQVAPMGGLFGNSPEIWLLTFTRPQ